MAEPGSSRPAFRNRFRRCDGGEHERGAALVETVVLLPLVLLIVFGIVEFSSAYHDASVTSDASRAGGRIASAQARNPSYATNAAESVSAALRTLPNDTPQELWIYRANNEGFPGTGDDFSSCTSSCIRYTWDPGADDWNYDAPGGGGWDAATHQVCSEPFDQIGVYVQIRHSFVTNLFGATLDLDDHSVFRFEPTPSAVCSTS
jgi:Flp pilus assembly protein TadG